MRLKYSGRDPLAKRDASGSEKEGSARAIVLFLTASLIGFLLFPSLMNSACSIVRTKSSRPVLIVDPLPADLWPLPVFEYERPIQPPSLIPPEREHTEVELASHGPTNASPEECALRVRQKNDHDAGSVQHDELCAYFVSSEKNDWSRERRHETIQNILATQEFPAGILVGWHEQLPAV